jgi:hypothetical protein
MQRPEGAALYYMGVNISRVNEQGPENEQLLKGMSLSPVPVPYGTVSFCFAAPRSTDWKKNDFPLGIRVFRNILCRPASGKLL